VLTLDLKRFILASNSFGNIFRITTWGESHGKAIGVVIDGCPSGIPIDETILQTALALRAPGRNEYTSPRKENDHAEILSGVFEGVTTGTPISIIIYNHDHDSSKYEPIKHLLRPGHANYTYLKKYGVFDHRGGGRASARETACRVAAGAIAKQFLRRFNIDVMAYVKQIGFIEASIPECMWNRWGCGINESRSFRNSIEGSPVFCPDEEASMRMIKELEKSKEKGDSLGGIVEFVVHGVPVGVGDPIYQKLEANLASAMMSIPATKGFEIGSGMSSVTMCGSEHNDEFVKKEEPDNDNDVNVNREIRTKTNHAGGILGGISNGMPVIGRVGFKPTSSIRLEQKTVDCEGREEMFVLPLGSRHDPCVAIRGVPVVEAMAALVLADAMLLFPLPCCLPQMFSPLEKKQ
jgi:chorismate synthase